MNQNKKIATSVVVLLLTMSLFSQEIVGRWQGVLSVQGVDLEIVFHIEKQNSEYFSIMDSPTQGAFDIPTTRTAFKNN